mmetsp:Transcript_60565/g.135010  ORF Transcript_60565/g.135010 Transcript_60565/m.135010 type:complete len:147 (-) Transcript_60565:245-685(-)
MVQVERHRLSVNGWKPIPPADRTAHIGSSLSQHVITPHEACTTLVLGAGEARERRVVERRGKHSVVGLQSQIVGVQSASTCTSPHPTPTNAYQYTHMHKRTGTRTHALRCTDARTARTQMDLRHAPCVLYLAIGMPSPVSLAIDVS